MGTLYDINFTLAKRTDYFYVHFYEFSIHIKKAAGIGLPWFIYLYSFKVCISLNIYLFLTTKQIKIERLLRY